MHGDLTIAAQTLLGFVMTLARLAGALTFVPMPGAKAGSMAARVVLAVTLTLALFPYWPHVSARVSAGELAVWMIAEAGLGIGVGLAVAFVLEGVSVAAQV